MTEVGWVPMVDVATTPSRGEDDLTHYHPQDLGRLAAKVRLPRAWAASWLDIYASLRMVLSLMMVPETGMVLASAIASVLIFEWGFHDLSVDLTWTTISFLLAFPLQNAIISAYDRREVAVQSLSRFRALLVNVLLANASWDWPGSEGFNGRSEGASLKKPGQRALSTQHTERVYALILRIMDMVHEFLLVPRGGCPRHEYCRSGRAEKAQIEDAELLGRRAILSLLQRLQGATEDLKAAGLPPNEGSRINQYNMQLLEAFERLWSIKTYRTPIGLRAIVRVFIQVLPFFYGPYWVHIAKNEQGEVTPPRLALSCLFSCAISLLLVAMMNLAHQLENPFQAGSGDAVRVQREMELTRECLKNAWADLGSPWHGEVAFAWEVVDDSLTSKSELEAPIKHCGFDDLEFCNILE